MGGIFTDLSNSFEDVFTAPGKANFGDYATVIGSLGAAAGAGYLTYGALAGSGAAAGSSGAAGASASGQASLDLFAPAGAPGSLTAGAFAPGAETAAVAGSSGFAPAIGATDVGSVIPGAAGASGGGILAGIGSFFSGVGATIKAGATAATGILSAYAPIAELQAAAHRVAPTIVPAPSGGGAGQPIVGNLTGGSKTTGAAPVAAGGVQQASLFSSPIIIFLIVGVALFFLFKRKK